MNKIKKLKLTLHIREQIQISQEVVELKMSIIRNAFNLTYDYITKPFMEKKFDNINDLEKKIPWYKWISYAFVYAEIISNVRQLKVTL